MLGPEEIAKRFGTTATEPEGKARHHDELRTMFIRLAQFIDVDMMDGRAKSIAFTTLEESSMWAHKALADSLQMLDKEPRA